MWVTINKSQQQQNHRLRADSSLSHRGLKCILLVPNLCARFCCCLNHSNLFSDFFFQDWAWLKLLNWSLSLKRKVEPPHEISNNEVCVASKGSDQPALTRSLIKAFATHLNIIWVLSYWQNSIGVSMLKRGCTGLSESTLVKMPHCWKSHVAAHSLIGENAIKNIWKSNGCFRKCHKLQEDT